jgi:hypothetical protein
MRDWKYTAWGTGLLVGGSLVGVLAAYGLAALAGLGLGFAIIGLTKALGLT